MMTLLIPTLAGVDLDGSSETTIFYDADGNP